MGLRRDTVTAVPRRVEPGDGPRLRAVRLQMLADTPMAYVETTASAENHSVEYWEERVADRATGSERALFVVERDGVWVATAGGFASEDDSTIVVSVFIAPEHRGTGILEALVEAVAAWSIECGRESLTLEVAKQNPRAVAAYRRLGFTLTGAEHPHPLYADVTELEMARPARP
jgi:predicted GNAT family acetyltransferase